MSRPPRLLGASLTLAALRAVSACAGSGSGSGSEDTEAAAATEGSWSFTDDLGTTVELDARPATQRTYGLLPATQAGQVHPWEYVGMDAAAQARYMERLAGQLGDARKVT